MGSQSDGDSKLLTGAASPAPGRSISSAEVLQHAVDQAAYFNLFACPEPGGRCAAITGRPGVLGVRINELLHRFRVSTEARGAAATLLASNELGECIGRFRQRWMIVPDDFHAFPDSEPPPTLLDPSRSQRFAMLDGVCRFGDGRDGFRSFGTGLTLPASVNGRRQLLAMAVGTVLGGFGKFEGLGEGTYVYCGQLVPEQGFMGNLMLRTGDPDQKLRTEQPLPELVRQQRTESGLTYVVFRGEAVPTDAVRPNLGPDGKQIGLIVEQGLMLHSIDNAAAGSEGIRATDRVGRRIGKITAHVAFDPNSASGTAIDPVPFTAYDEFVFFGPQGESIGSFTADSREGRVFNVSILGQPGIRFGGVGRILDGVGAFSGIDGLMTDNSVVVFKPHVSASVYVLRINDPGGRFSKTVNES